MIYCVCVERLIYTMPYLVCLLMEEHPSLLFDLLRTPVKTHDKAIEVCTIHSNDVDRRWNTLPQLRTLLHTRARIVQKDLASDFPENTNVERDSHEQSSIVNVNGVDYKVVLNS